MHIIFFVVGEFDDSIGTLEKTKANNDEMVETVTERASKSCQPYLVCFCLLWYMERVVCIRKR